MKNILVIGFDTRNIVCSAKKAGYRVCSIDAFCDLDLQKCAYMSRTFDFRDPQDLKRLSPEELQAQVDGFGLDFDALIVGSGFEGFDFSKLSCPVFSNRPENMREASDKGQLAKKLKTLGIPHPEAYFLEEPESIRYPVMVKPKRGGGGIMNRVARNPEELEAVYSELSSVQPGLRPEDLLIQEFISGIPASVSVLSTESEARAVAVNEQLIGTSWLSNLPFTYCGNITPFETSCSDEIKRIAEELVLDCNLLGSNGVDFMVTAEGPVVLEVNPRFQGSLDTVELSTGMNLFEAHMRAFSGELPECPEVERFSARGILYSDRELFIDQKLMEILLLENCADIPNHGWVAGPGTPLISLLATAATRAQVLNSVKESADRIKNYINMRG